MPEKRQRIGYLTFGRDEFGYGLALCLSELRRHEVFRVSPKTAKIVDWLVFSCFWWEHIYVLADFLRKANIKKADGERPRIVMGGFNTVNPVPFLAYADFVVVGDGEGILPRLMAGELPDNVMTDDKKTCSYGCADMKPFCHETNGIARIELARGCKAKCTFCAVTHLKPYREVRADQIKSVLKTTKCKRVSLFAPEPTMHSQDDLISIICHNYGKVRVDSDVRLDRLDKRSDSVPRVGIEGLSEKLRKSIKKPYKNETIVEAVRKAIADGRRGMFMYLILDLPRETTEDWEEFRELCKIIGELHGSDKFVLKPSPSVFLPTPHTPMQYDAIHWDRDYHAKWEQFFGRGDDRDWNVIMAERSRVFSPHMRLLSMVSTRAGEEFSDFERLATHNDAIGISGGRPIVRDRKKLEKCVERFGGIGKYCGEIQEGPWEVVKLPTATKAAA